VIFAKFVSKKILIKCCLCHHQVSINAACCPNCGEPDFESISLTTEIDSVLPVADEDADDEVPAEHGCVSIILGPFRLIGAVLEIIVELVGGVVTVGLGCGFAILFIALLIHLLRWVISFIF